MHSRLSLLCPRFAQCLSELWNNVFDNGKRLSDLDVGIVNKLRKFLHAPNLVWIMGFFGILVMNQMNMDIFLKILLLELK